MEVGLSLIAGVIVLIGYIVYARDIIAGRAKPARSARLMFVVLLIVTLLQQHSLQSGWLLALTVSEALGSIAILALSLKKGMGGITRIDIACYLLLSVDVLVWVTTKDALLALHLSILADAIAFAPTIIKTWQKPWTETPQFFIYGAIAAPLTLVANNDYRYAAILFPVYLGLANLFEFTLVLVRQRQVPKLA